jgi:hypothetical protein
MVAAGIALLAGWVTPDFPAGNNLKNLLGWVVILLGIHRWVASRYSGSLSERRRYGGDRTNPWERD